MFKEKSVTKKKALANTNPHHTATLDARHQQMIAALAEKQKDIDQLRQKITALNDEREKLHEQIVEFKTKEKTDDPVYHKIWDRYMSSQDSIKELEIQIKSRENCKEEIEYYEKTANILFDYYSLLEEQTEGVSMPMPIIRPPQPTKKSKKALPPPGKSILLKLGIVEEPGGGGASVKGSGDDHTDADIGPCRKDKSLLVEEYISCVDQQQLHKIPYENTNPVCNACKEAFIANYYEGILYCPICGQQEVLLVEQNRPAQKQQNKETSHFSYKRINHLNEWVSQIQGKESTEIPTEIFDSILNEIRKERITDPEKITFNKMREILKRLKLNRYYEHIPYIMTRIHGVPTPYFPPELEEKLRHMFKEIQAPFLRHCPKHRKNFLSYSYVLYKFFQLLGKDEYLKFFPLLKSREKLACQDAIWKGVCEDLGWKFYPSV